jgi:acetyl-CoA acetyltransferase
MPETAENVAADSASRAPTRTRSRCARSSAGRAAPQAAASRRDRAGQPSQQRAPRRRRSRRAAAADTTLEKRWPSCRAVPAGGRVTAGNASGVNDGAAALIVASEAAAKPLRPDAARPHRRDGDRRGAAAHHGHRPDAGVRKRWRGSGSRSPPST